MVWATLALSASSAGAQIVDSSAAAVAAIGPAIVSGALGSSHRFAGIGFTAELGKIR